MMDEKLKVTIPYGHLFTNNRDYLLIKPFPITGDNWEGDNCYRFLVVPDEALGMQQKGKDIYPVYDYARHLVTNCFTIEYKEMEEIHYIASEEIKFEQKEIEEDDEKDEYPF